LRLGGKDPARRSPHALTAMTQRPNAMASHFAGIHAEPTGLAGFLVSSGVVRSESMDVINDPRFFQDNVINYRLAAFSGLSVVSGLLTQNTMTELFDMNKNMQLFTQNHRIFHPMGILQLIAFMLLIVILGMNMLATYVGVAQPYHTIRLMTAGPTGFDSAASYYLNQNIVVFRHAAIRSMLTSLPLFILQIALRLMVKFDRDTEKQQSVPTVSPFESHIQGIIFCSIMALMSIALYLIHIKHFAIFRDRYNEIHSSVTGTGFTQYMQGVMTARKTTGFLDV